MNPASGHLLAVCVVHTVRAGATSSIQYVYAPYILQEHVRPVCMQVDPAQSATASMASDPSLMCVWTGAVIIIIPNYSYYAPHNLRSLARIAAVILLRCQKQALHVHVGLV